MEPIRTVNRPLSAAVTLKRASARAFAERAAQRANHLDEPERQLLLAVCQRGQKATEIAALVGENVRRTRRRIRGLLRRVMSREFALVVAQREAWGTTMRAVGDACIVRGHSLNRAAATLGLTYHAVRRHRDAIVAMANAAGPVHVRRVGAPAAPPAPMAEESHQARGIAA